MIDESLGRLTKCALAWQGTTFASDVNALVAELERLRAELAEAKRDAERYRWLRDSKIADDADRWICAHECTVHEVAELDGERLDAAIDRARGAE